MLVNLNDVLIPAAVEAVKRETAKKMELFSSTGKGGIL